MWARFIHFIKYHNAFTVAIVLLLISSSAFAASPAARDAVVASEEFVASVDNTYIVNVNLDAFEPRIQITSVSEDEESYTVAYTLQSIDLVDGVWQDVLREKEMTVAKGQLGERDLGLYVTEQLSQVVARELRLLRETQTFERDKGATQKVVATAYSGLVGKFLDPKAETLPGYQPVKPPPPEPEPQQTTTATTQTDTQTTDTSGTDTNTSGDTQPPTIQILGNNPAEIELGSMYSDLGAAVTDNVNNNLGYKVTGANAVDTSIVGEYTVTYTATDGAGNTATATRTVIVFDPNATTDTSSTDTSTTTSDGTATTTDETADTTPPEITLNGSASVELEQGSAYEEAGASATDDTDGDLSGAIQIAGSVDTATPGEYTITYSVADAAGNTAEATRTVTVVAPADTTPPEITLNGAAAVEIETGTSYDDAGATATDDVDGDISASITVSGSVDTSTAGEYVLRYNVADAAGNAAAEVTRTVTVVEPAADDSTSTTTDSTGS